MQASGCTPHERPSNERRANTAEGRERLIMPWAAESPQERDDKHSVLERPHGRILVAGTRQDALSAESPSASPGPASL
jgi:hypothetical protein